MYLCNMLMQSWLLCQRPSCFSATIFAGRLSTAEVGDGPPENEGSLLPPEGEGQGEGINLPARACPCPSPLVPQCGTRIVAISAGTSSDGIQVPPPGGDRTLYCGLCMPGSRIDHRSRWRTVIRWPKMPGERCSWKVRGIGSCVFGTTRPRVNFNTCANRYGPL
jgi:hypothetical protein